MNVKKTIAALVCLALIGCARADPIDTLVNKLSKDQLWRNGAFPIVALPETASHEDVVAQSFKMTSLNRQIKDWKIIRIRKVAIRGPFPDGYFAGLIDSEFGNKIVIFQYLGPERGWWTRIYDE